MLNEDDSRDENISSVVKDGDVCFYERRGRVSEENLDPRYKLFMENLREDGNSYALEVVEELGVSERIRYHREEDGVGKRFVRERLPDEELDPQYKLFMERLRVDGHSYALEIVGEDGATELIRYHSKEEGFERRVKRGRVPDEDLDPQYKLFRESLRADGNSYAVEVVDESGVTELKCYHHESHSRRGFDDNSETEFGDDSFVKRGFLSEHENEESGDDSTYFKSVLGGDKQNEQFSDDNSLIGSVEDDDNMNEQSGDDNDLDILNVPPGRKSLSVKHNAGLVALDPAPDMETGACLKVPCNPEALCKPESLSVLRLKEKPIMEISDSMELFELHRERKSSVVKENAESAHLKFVSDLENRVSSKRPCLEVANIPVELSSDDSEILRSSPVNEKPVMGKPFQDCRGKKSLVVKKKAKFDIPNSVASRTRGNSSKQTQSEAHTSFTSSSLKEKMEKERALKRVKKEKVKERPNKSAPVLNKEETKGPEKLRNKRSEYLPSSEKHYGIKGCRGKKKKNVKKGAEYRYSDRNVEYPNTDRNTGYPCSVRKTKYHDRKPGPKTHFRYMTFAKSNLKGGGDAKTEFNQIDECCQAFISGCETIESEYECITHAPRTSKRDSPQAYDNMGIYDKKNVESLSDSDLIVLERDSAEECRTPNKDSHYELESNIDFRAGLLKELKRPYDEQEYLMLLEDWSNQVPAKGHAKNLRNGAIKTYGLEGEYAKCYSNIYPDLAAMIKASNRQGSSNLMRGFFYWLKNVAQDGSFEPWTDEECLNVVPQM